MASIRDVLRERNDLSTFIVHLTKGPGDEAFHNLVKILSERRIEARSYFGLPYTRRLAERFNGTEFSRTQQAVCFTETPLMHVRHMCTEIDNRTTKLRDYGLAFTRNDARRMGANPLWYVDTTHGQPGARAHRWLTYPFRELIDEAICTATPTGSSEPDPAELVKRPIFSLTPFIETMGMTQDRRRKEFWWEREWRKVGSLSFRPAAVVAAIAPMRHHDDLRTALSTLPGYVELRIVDPAWDGSEIDAALAGIDAEPFPA